MVSGISSIGSNSNSAPAELSSKLQQLGVPSDIISQGREAVMQYCEENSISLPQPPEQTSSQSSIFGQTSDSSTAGNDGEPPEELKAELVALGIPQSVISQGRDAVATYAEQNDITLPEPPAAPQGQTGSNLNLTA